MAASSENLAAIDPFLLRQSFSDLCWLNPADNEKAIQQPALYGNHHDYSSLQPDHDHDDQSYFSPFSLQQTHPSTPDPKRRIAASVNNNNKGKSRITKRKSRATKKNQTTFITADPANFRQMVQQVTGIRLDTSSPLSHLLKPETTRSPIGRLLYNAACQLPTLDTSSFLLEHNVQQQQQKSQSVMASSDGALVVDGETGYGASDGFGIATFPTLESWKVM